MKRTMMIPMAAAAALLTLGACGNDADDAVMDTGMAATPAPAMAPAPMDSMGAMGMDSNTMMMDSTRRDSTMMAPPPQ